MCQEETEGEERFAGLIDGGDRMCSVAKVSGRRSSPFEGRTGQRLVSFRQRRSQKMRNSELVPIGLPPILD